MSKRQNRELKSIKGKRVQFPIMTNYKVIKKIIITNYKSSTKKITNHHFLPLQPYQHSKIILSPSYFICPLFYFEMSQNIVLFLKIKVINLLMFLLYPYLLMFLLIIQFFDKFI